MIRSFLVGFFLSSTVGVSLGQDGTITDDQFAERPFEIELTLSSLRRVMPGKWKEEKKWEPNKHTGEADTLLIYKSTDGEFTFLKSAGKVWFVEANISGRGIKLAKGIRIGLPKDSFIKLFSTDEKFNDVNPIVVTNAIDYGFHHSFYFERGKLARINLNAWPD